MSKEADRNDHDASHLQLELLEKDEEFQLPAEATYTNDSDLNPLDGNVSLHCSTERRYSFSI